MARPKKFDPDDAVVQAMALFWTKGYGGSSPQELGDRMGIGRGSLYNTFASKHALFELALTHYHEREAIKLLGLLKGPGPVKMRIRALFDAVIDTDLADPERRGCLAVNTAIELGRGDPAAKGIVDGTFDRIESCLTAAVEEGQRSGEIDASRDATALGSFLFNALTGIRVLCKTAEDRTRLDRVVETTLKVI